MPGCARSQASLSLSGRCARAFRSIRRWLVREARRVMLQRTSSASRCPHSSVSRVGDVAVDRVMPRRRSSAITWVEVDDQHLVEQNLAVDRHPKSRAEQDRARVRKKPRKTTVSSRDSLTRGAASPTSRSRTWSNLILAQHALHRVARVDHVGRDDRGDREGHDHDRQNVAVDLGHRQGAAKRCRSRSRLADCARLIAGRRLARWPSLRA